MIVRAWMCNTCAVRRQSRGAERHIFAARFQAMQGQAYLAGLDPCEVRVGVVAGVLR